MTYYCGIDGEGKGRKDHKYILLAAANETLSKKWYIEKESGLNTEECLNFILDLPSTAKLFAFSFNYDLTKMLVDLENGQLFHLFRPEERRRKNSKVSSPWPVLWNGYSLNLVGTKFSISKGKKRRIIWDVFKFYQSKFVAALRDWKVGEFEELEKMERMKNLRSEFDKQDSNEIREYCFSECASLAQLVRKLDEAHEKANIKLENYYGAGSTGGAILEKMGIEEKRRDPPNKMREYVAQAFFGGRFEHSVIGPIKGPVYSYDISSAYPYQCVFLPCLEHGRWIHTRNRDRIYFGKSALVHYRIDKKIESSWAPFPYREPDSTIVFPAKSEGGWVWLDEYLQGEKLYPNNVEFIEAYVLYSDCKCRPFGQISEFYSERLKIGKEGPGIVLKLGCNSVYGKLAQSIGEPPFQSWIWAGMITSGCRAQILQMIGMHKNRDNLLAVATDGIYTRENLGTPRPKDTGTFNAINEKGEKANKPLGGWEKKIVDKGVFFARPGIYFPLAPTEDELKTVRARGIGRAAMMACWQNMVDSWNLGKEEVEVVELIRFCGAKSSISVRSRKNKPTYHRSENYGQWVKRPVFLSLNPKPKREREIERIEDFGILKLRSIDLKLQSMPYKPSILSQDAKILKMMAQEELEQPENDFLDQYDEH